MKKTLLILGMLCLVSVARAQHRAADSLRNLLSQARTDTGYAGRVYLLTCLAEQYLNNSLDTALLYSGQAYKLAKKTDDPDGLSRAANIIGTVYLKAGNYSKALEYYIQKLKVDEKWNSKEMLAIALMNIAVVHTKEGNYEKAIAYTFQCDSIIETYKLARWKIYTLFNLGDMYEKSGKLDAALSYTQKAYALALKESNIDFQAAAFNNLGNIYARIGITELAIQNYKFALPLLEQVGDYAFQAESAIGLARQYQLLMRNDSALKYGLLSYEISRQQGFLNRQLEAGLFLTQLYKLKKDIQSAFNYQEEALALNDSIFSKEKIARSQFLSMEEDLRQKDLAEKRAEAEKARIVQLQFLTIGLVLPILFFITLYLSNRKIKPRYIEFLGLVSLLLTFEYIMLLIHPLVARITHHLPFYQLLIFAAIASILTPAHHRIEQWLLKLLARKEKLSVFKIRIQ
jgi:tetratricopeptide (TPR) repeat protein